MLLSKYLRLGRCNLAKINGLPQRITRGFASERPSSPAVVVIGASVMDMIAYVPRFPATGETLHGSSFVTGFGGKGTNTSP